MPHYDDGVAKGLAIPICQHSQESSHQVWVLLVGHHDIPCAFHNLQHRNCLAFNLLPAPLHLFRSLQAENLAYSVDVLD